MPKVDQTFEDAPRRKQAKIDTNRQKKTYIDLIFHENTKANYPKPGPGEYFLDSRSVKKFKKDHEDLYEKKTDTEVTRKDCLG